MWSIFQRWIDSIVSCLSWSSGLCRGIQCKEINFLKEQLCVLCTGRAAYSLEGTLEAWIVGGVCMFVWVIKTSKDFETGAHE